MVLTYKSAIAAAAHESMEGLYNSGVIAKKTMREFDDLCLTPVREFTPEDIQKLRAREGLSQPVFARYTRVR